MTISRRTLLATVGAGAVAAATGITVAAEAVETTTAVPAGPELFPAQLPVGTSPSVGYTSLYQTVDAEAAVQAAGLAAGSVTSVTVFDSSDGGKVMSQSLNPGLNVRQGRRLT